jgi:hypothetical protein
MPFGHSIRKAYAEGRKLTYVATGRAARCPNCFARPPRALGDFDRESYARTPGIGGTRDLCFTCYESGQLLLCPLDEFNLRVGETTREICIQALRDELAGERRSKYATALQHRLHRIQREMRRLIKKAGAAGGRKI